MVTPRTTRKYRFQNLLAALLLLMLVFPWIARHLAATRFLGLTFTLLLIAGVAAVAETRKRLVTALAIGAPMLFAAWAAELSDAALLRIAGQAGAVVFYIFLLWVVLRAVFSQETVEADTLYGAACGYLLLGMAWTSLYALVLMVDPLALTGTGVATEAGQPGWPGLMYFSFVTLTTLGYGDIAPVSGTARSLTIVEAATGVLYIAIVVARLVGLYRGEGSDRPARTD